MDYSNWAQIQQNPNPNPNPEYSVLHAPNHSLGYSQNLVPDLYQPLHIDPHSALFLHPQPRPPGVDPPYVPPPLAVNYAQQPIVYEAQQGADAAAAAAAAAAYYPDPNVSWLAPIPQFGTTPCPAGVSTPNPAIQLPRRSPSIWKYLPKKTKVVQSAWCEVCKIDCNSKGVLDQHKLGKKHLKNLQKLEAPTPTISAPIIVAPSPAIIVEPPTSIAVAPASIVTSTSFLVPTPAPASTDEPMIGPQENLAKSKSKSQKSRKKSAARTEDLETKRRKVLEGGAAAEAVRACSICNVVCNSDTVFNHHIAGQKHASMAKKLASRAGVATVV